jgi:hypothetical protein
MCFRGGSPDTNYFRGHQIRTGLIRTGLVFVILFAGVSMVEAQNRNLSGRWSVAFETGIWQPHTLNDEPAFNTFGAAGATPFFGVSCYLPLGGDFSLRLTLGYWALRDLKEVENVHSIALHPLMLDIKYWLVPDPKLSAYVMYGGGVVWGIENEKLPLGERLYKARAGWGGNLGAGFDLALFRWLGFGMVFQYHYVWFNLPLGGVQDFSGPKVSGVFSFLF